MPSMHRDKTNPTKLDHATVREVAQAACTPAPTWTRPDPYPTSRASGVKSLRQMGAEVSPTALPDDAYLALLELAEAGHLVYAYPGATEGTAYIAAAQHGLDVAGWEPHVPPLEHVWMVWVDVGGTALSRFTVAQWETFFRDRLEHLHRGGLLTPSAYVTIARQVAAAHNGHLVDGQL